MKINDFMTKYAGKTIAFSKLSSDEERYIFVLLKAYTYYCTVCNTKKEAYAMAAKKANIDRSSSYVHQIRYGDVLTIPNRRPKANNMFTKGRNIKS